jgi:ATP-dependent DNA helicase RecQ
VCYTVIGGRLPDDVMTGIAGSARVPAVRAVSQAFVAVSHTAEPASGSVRYWATVVRKVIQRGTRPVIHHPAAGALQMGAPVEQDQLLAGIAGPDLSSTVDLCESIDLHETYEVPFWTRLTAEASVFQRFCTPQASLEGISGTRGKSERWVDFLVYAPWSSRAVVIEVDGSGHKRQMGVDRERDQKLQKSGARVERQTGPDVSSPTSETFRRLRLARPKWIGSASDPLLAEIHGPSALHRLAYAIAEGVERGFLPVGHPWVIDLDDDTSATAHAATVSLDLVASVADVWMLDIIPDSIIINGVSYGRAENGRFHVVEHGVSAEPQLKIRLEAFVPPSASLTTDEAPSVVIRGALLPVDLQWTPPTSTKRVSRQGSARSDRALNHLLSDLFGHSEYREGQRAAISRVLSGGDACVLLPTGAGKSIIYQVAGLLRPGVTLVVAPLKALIDDQVRRLADGGIDRVVGLHSGRGLDKTARVQIQRAIGVGEALMVLIAPERLQIQDFRRELRRAAADHLVNLAVVDEAHCVSEWGHQFRTSYLKLGRNLRLFGRDKNDGAPPVLALTATASPRVLNDMLAELGFDRSDPGLMYRPESFDRKNLRYRIFSGPADQRENQVRAAITWVSNELGVHPSELAQTNGPDTRSGIVFVPDASSGRNLGLTKYKEVMEHHLGGSDKNPYISIYAGKEPNSRDERFNDLKESTEWERVTRDLEGRDAWEVFKASQANLFRVNKRAVMVSTNAFGMGIDKPNIRFTLHVIHPSSIEGYAQECGRAGRDGDLAFCAVVASNPAQEAVLGTLDRRRMVPLGFPKTDVEIALSNLLSAFPDKNEEFATARGVFAELLEVPDVREVKIPRALAKERGQNPEIEARNRERALFRLLLLGVVDDYTIEYRANTFTVWLGPFDEATVVATAQTFLDRSTGGSRRYRDRLHVLLATEPTLTELVNGLLPILLDVIYDNIEPSRIEALREMFQLTEAGIDDETIRRRINGYLSVGPMSVLLDKVVQGEASVTQVLDSLDTLEPSSEEEWVGPAQRYLESYPDQPVLLAIRALGEAFREAGDRTVFLSLTSSLIQSLPDFGIEDHDATRLIAWILSRLRGYFTGRSWSWTSDVWDACQHLDEAVMAPLEERVLREAGMGHFHASELDAVLARRLSRTRARLNNRLSLSPRL